MRQGNTSNYGLASGPSRDLEAETSDIVVSPTRAITRLVAKREADDKVDVGGADVGPSALRELPDQISRRQPSGKVDPLPPRANVAQ